jgi:hypothetical protein
MTKAAGTSGSYTPIHLHTAAGLAYSHSVPHCISARILYTQKQSSTQPVFCTHRGSLPPSPYFVDRGSHPPSPYFVHTEGSHPPSPTPTPTPTHRHKMLCNVPPICALRSHLDNHAQAIPCQSARYPHTQLHTATGYRTPAAAPPTVRLLLVITHTHTNTHSHQLQDASSIPLTVRLLLALRNCAEALARGLLKDRLTLPKLLNCCW